MKIAFRGLAAAGLAVLVAACSGEPSADDISNALERALRAERDQLKSFTTGVAGGSFASPVDDIMLDIRIDDLEKIGCEASADNAYRCNVRFSASGGMLGSKGRSTAQSLNLLHTSDGWMLAGR